MSQLDQGLMQQFLSLEGEGRGYVVRRFPDLASEAEDVVQEVIIRLSSRSPEEITEKPRALFFTAVKNECIDRIRYRQARPAISLEAIAHDTSIKQEQGSDEARPFALLDSFGHSRDDVEELVARRFDRARALAALREMRPNYAQTMLLRIMGFSVPEIADLRGLSLPGAKKLVFRSERQFRKVLDLPPRDTSQRRVARREASRRKKLKPWSPVIAELERLLAELDSSREELTQALAVLEAA